MNEPARPSSTRPLRLAPFRALRYDPRVVPDLGAVTCPPYDVIAADRVSVWEAADPHNVVRLILPRSGDGADRYTHAARDLRRWLGDGVLTRDGTAGLYVYHHVTRGGSALGLVGAVSLHEPDERRILPHEDVFAGPVADRAALMAATGAQLEPILLTYDGDGPASDIVDQATTRDPVIETSTPDGAVHRIWAVTDPNAMRVIAADLAERRALIADGHHRYAAYLRLRQGAAPGTQAGLAMLVDASRHPLRLGAIHRSVAGLRWPAAVEAARNVFRAVHPLRSTDADAILEELARSGSSGDGLAFAVCAGPDGVLVTDPDPAAITAGMPADRSARWRSLDASIARELMLGRLWRVPDTDPRVHYHHDASDALATAQEASRVALLLNPPRHEDVVALAAEGERMPRKSTSFGPKPWTGLLMRLLG